MNIQIKHLLGVLLLVIAVLAPPAAVANFLAGAAGLAVLGASTGIIGDTSVRSTHMATVFAANELAHSWRLFELDSGAGVVVFREVNGKLVSRYYRSSASGRADLV